MNILEIQHLTKRYGEHIALDDVNLCVERGSIFGLLGPNGAGKTTLLRIINSILVSDSGSVKINGAEASIKNTSRIIGYMPEERGLYPKMKVEDQIMYFGLLKGFDKATLRQNMVEYMELFNLTSARKRKVEELSKGNQQKVQILSTIVYNPELIILDEPFSGFDPINGVLLTSLIERLRQRNATIILSSHNMPAIENMCDSIAIINKGRKLVDGNLEEIKQANKSGILSFATASPISTEIASDSPFIKAITPATNSRSKKAWYYHITPVDGVSNNDVINEIAMQAQIISFEELLPSLSELFLQYTTTADTSIQ